MLGRKQRLFITEADHIKKEALQQIDDTIKDVVTKVYKAFFQGLSNNGDFVVLLLEGRIDEIKHDKNMCSKKKPELVYPPLRWMKSLFWAFSFPGKLR